jgi:cell division protein FtsQ
MQRAAAFPRVRPLPRPPRAALWIAVVLAVLGAAFLWLRDSSLVAVQKVTVTGLTGPQAPHLRRVLEDTARDMTTLHADAGRLRKAVAAYPTIKDLAVSSHFPHGMTIAVRENVAVAAVYTARVKTPVAGDGRLLPGAAVATLPVVPATTPSADGRVTDRGARRVIAVLAAAPPALRARVIHGGVTREGGLTLALRRGPELRFGGVDRLAAKWAAAAAVLADRSSVGATYLDLRYPERPAAGGLEDPATQRDPVAADAATQTTPDATGAPAMSPTP